MELQRRSDNNGNETKRIGPQPAGKAGPVWLSGYSNSHRLFSPDLFGPHPPQADDSSHQHRFCFHWVMLKNHWTLQMLRKYYSYFFLCRPVNPRPFIPGRRTSYSTASLPTTLHPLSVRCTIVCTYVQSKYVPIPPSPITAPIPASSSSYVVSPFSPYARALLLLTVTCHTHRKREVYPSLVRIGLNPPPQ